MLLTESAMAMGGNLYMYCYNNPIMFRDDNGYGFFTTLLVMTIAGIIIGGTMKGVSAYNDGARGWELAGAIGAGALTGGALGAAFALGGIAGASVKAGVGILGLSVGKTVGLTLGIALGVNLAAGMGGYAIEAGTNPSMQFNAGRMVMAGFAQTGKALVNYTLGGMMAASGVWKIGQKLPLGTTISDLIARTAARQMLTFIPFTVINGMFGF